MTDSFHVDFDGLSRVKTRLILRSERMHELKLFSFDAGDSTQAIRTATHDVLACIAALTRDMNDIIRGIEVHANRSALADHEAAHRHKLLLQRERAVWRHGR